jgi:hypothetical protein
MKKTFEEFVKEIGLTSAVIICYRDTEKVPATRFSKGQRSMRPDLPEGILDRLPFEEWMGVIRDPSLRLTDNLRKIGHKKASELANTPGQCISYLRYFGIECQQDRDVLERLIMTGDFLELRDIRHRIPFEDPLIAVWMKRFVELAEESGDFDCWLDVCEQAESKSPERKLALRKMCELEELSINF